MKYTFLILLICLGCFAKKKPNNKTILKVKDDYDKQLVSEINFYNYYNLSLSNLLDVPAFRTYNKFYASFDPTFDCIDHLYFKYNKNTSGGVIELEVFLQEFPEYCEDNPEKFNFQDVNSFKDIKIRKIYVYDQHANSIITTGIEGLPLLDSLTRINLIHYKGKPVKKLLNETILHQFNYVSFIEHRPGCLQSVRFLFNNEPEYHRPFCVEIRDFKFKKLKKCLDLKNEYWNFNDFLEEKIVNVRFIL